MDERWELSTLSWQGGETKEEREAGRVVTAMTWGKLKISGLTHNLEIHPDYSVVLNEWEKFSHIVYIWNEFLSDVNPVKVEISCLFWKQIKYINKAMLGPSI